MRVRAFVVGCAVVLAATGCGGDSGDDQSRVADLLIDAAAEAGASPDESCLRDLADQISDADAAAIVAAGLDGDPDISAATGETLAEMLLC